MIRTWTYLEPRGKTISYLSLRLGFYSPGEDIWFEVDLELPHLYLP